MKSKREQEEREAEETKGGCGWEARARGEDGWFGFWSVSAFVPLRFPNSSLAACSHRKPPPSVSLAPLPRRLARCLCPALCSPPMHSHPPFFRWPAAAFTRWAGLGALPARGRLCGRKRKRGAERHLQKRVAGDPGGLGAAPAGASAAPGGRRGRCLCLSPLPSVCLFFTIRLPHPVDLFCCSPLCVDSFVIGEVVVVAPSIAPSTSRRRLRAASTSRASRVRLRPPRRIVFAFVFPVVCVRQDFLCPSVPSHSAFSVFLPCPLAGAGAGRVRLRLQSHLPA